MVSESGLDNRNENDSLGITGFCGRMKDGSRVRGMRHWGLILLIPLPELARGKDSFLYRLPYDKCLRLLAKKKICRVDPASAKVTSSTDPCIFSRFSRSSG
jgi:hypothetical protein